MAKNPDGRFGEELRKLVNDEIQRNVTHVTHKLKQQASTAKADKDDALKAADSLRRQLKETTEKVKNLEERNKTIDRDLARAKVTIRSLQDQNLKQEAAAKG